MEVYQRVYTGAAVVLAEYNDLSRKLAFVSKKTGGVILAKAYPTSQACERFTFAVGLEIPTEALSQLIKTIGGLSKGARDLRVIIHECENYKRQHRRLVIERDHEYCGWILAWETEALQTADLVFAKDGEESISTADKTNDVMSSYNRDFGVFYIKKEEDLKKMCSALRIIASEEKKKKIGEPKKKRLRPLEDDDDDIRSRHGDEDDGETLAIAEVLNGGIHTDFGEIGLDALASLYSVYSYKKESLSLTDCVYTYNGSINRALGPHRGFNFIKYLMSSGGSETTLLELFEEISKFSSTDSC